MGFGPSRCSFAPLLGAQTSRTVAQTLCVDVARSVDSEQRRDDLLDKAVPAILCAIRETDIAGWHQEHSALEVIFAELGATDQTSTLAALRAKATGILQSVLRPEEISHLRIAFHCFPDEWGQDHTGVPIEKLYPDLVQRDESRKIPRAIKRVTDVLGSAMALILLAPIVLIVALRSSCPRPDRSCTARSGPVSTVCHSRA